jgi:hypothetical protein
MSSLPDDLSLSGTACQKTSDQFHLGNLARRRETQDFIETYGITFPVLLDEALQKSVEFELSSVPSIFLIGQDGRIGKSIIGFVKSDLESLNATLAELSVPERKDSVGVEHGSASAAPRFTPGDQVPEFRPG